MTVTIKKSHQAMSDHKWTPERIRSLRKDLGMSQREMGHEIWEGSDMTVKKNLSRLENGHYEPSASIRRTLRRLENLSKGLIGGEAIVKSLKKKDDLDVDLDDWEVADL